ncbi:MAG: hypothetical protein ACI8QS_003125 [Planctomycetota bacterium]|jgi:hypothetical protein
MKALLSFVAGGLILATGVVSTQTPLAAVQQDSDLEPRMAALEREVSTLQEENAQLRVLLDSTVAYLEAQSRSSKEMLASLDVSEGQGFTKGINYRSRETMIAAFRSFWKGVSTGLPTTVKPEEEAEQKPANGRLR